LCWNITSIEKITILKKRSMLELNRLSVESYKETPKTPIVVLLDNIRSAHNVGSAFRTSDAFLVQEIALCGITAQPPHREILKTAIGATKSVAWQHFESTQEAVAHYRAQGFQIAAVEQAEGSIALQNVRVQAQDKVAVVFGNEVKGVDQDIMNSVDFCIEIPQFGTKHSFNISVSMGIVLWSLVQKIRPDLITQE
jgi:tRNA G18 (ribose-2'-O)-methylase SpoU